MSKNTDQIDARVELVAAHKRICTDGVTRGKSDTDLMVEVALAVHPTTKDRILANKKDAGYLRRAFEDAVELFDARAKHNLSDALRSTADAASQHLDDETEAEADLAEAVADFFTPRKRTA